MRPTTLCSTLLTGLLLAGCGHAAVPTGTAPQLSAPRTATIVSNNSARLAAVAAEPEVHLETAATAAVVAHAIQEDLPPFVADQDDPPTLRVAEFAGDEPPSYNVDDRTPFNVVVVEKSAHTVTIAWHTEVPTKGVIDYGRTWGFAQNGYTDHLSDDVAKSEHQLTLTNLRRFTGYTYRVTAITSLGLRFEEKQRTLRTKFWSWR